MEIQFNEHLLDQIFDEFVSIDELDDDDLEIIRVLLYDDIAQKKGLLVKQINKRLPEEYKTYKTGKRLRMLISNNIVGELPNLLDMRSNRYYLVCLQKYRRK